MTVVLVLAGAAAVLLPVTVVAGLLEGHGLIRRRSVRRRVVLQPQQQRVLEAGR